MPRIIESSSEMHKVAALAHPDGGSTERVEDQDLDIVVGAASGEYPSAGVEI